jgi:trimethylamine:corrinoid methyltransferase-like protein
MDKVLWKIAAVELAKSYNIPVSSECGGTMTYRYDQQNGAEGMIFMLAAQNSRSDILTGFGSCHNANGMSAEMIMIQSAWLDASKHLSKGIATDNRCKGIDSIKNIGAGGSFLTDDLTIEMLYSDEFLSEGLFDFSGDYEEAPSLLEKAHQKTEELVKNYSSPVPEKVQEELKSYFEKLYHKVL